MTRWARGGAEIEQMATQATASARAIIDAAAKMLEHLGFF
jgi:hypothetical protein